MKVELIACSRPLPGQCGTVKNPMDITPNPVRIIEQAASVCYDSEPDFTAFKIAETCAKTGHLSVYEHSYFTFHVTGIVISAFPCAVSAIVMRAEPSQFSPHPPMKIRTA